MDTTEIGLHTGDARGVFDVTDRLAEFVAGRGDGLLSVFVPHATAGIAIIETGAGSDLDLLDRVDAVLPRRDAEYRHRHGAPGHGADHVLPAFVAPSITIPVVDGTMTLGVWQSVVLVDPNESNPSRRIRLTFLAA